MESRNTNEPDCLVGCPPIKKRFIEFIAVCLGALVLCATQLFASDSNRVLSFNLTDDGVYYFPIGTHYLEDQDLAFPHMVALTHGPITLTAFENSFSDPVVAVAQGRELYANGRFGTDLFYGIMVGYQGKLESSDYVPKPLRPLYKGNISPIVAISPHFEVSNSVELRAMLAPGFLALGFKYKY